MSPDRLLRGPGPLFALALVACEGGGGSDDLDRIGHDDGPPPAALTEDAAVPAAPPPSPEPAASSCTIPPDCDSVPLVVVDLEACCTATTACGFAVRGGLPDFQDTVAQAVGLAEGETCAPRDRYFIEHESIEDMRVPTEDGKDILLSAGCNSASILSITFSGCCMPNDRCGVSTYGIWDTIAVLTPSAPFAKLQCTSATELNDQLARSSFRGLRYLPDTDAPCDYAALDAQLPPVTYRQPPR